MQLNVRSSMFGANIAFVPSLLPDELLYSWLARLAALNAMGSPRDVLQQLFDCRTMVPSVDLPSRLLATAERLGGLLPFANLDSLIENGTLLPYHRPFLTDSVHSRVRHRLLHGGGQGLKTLMGRVANGFGAHPALRSCSDCLAENWSRHGSMYWIRRHQLPGVNCCTIHGIGLQNLPLQDRTHRQRLLLPSATPTTRRELWADSRQLRFAQLSQDLVEAALPVIEPLRRAAIYREAALTLGHSTRRGKVDFPDLASSLRRHFNDFQGFDHQARLLATAANPLGWLRSIFEKPQRSLHPICHLLLIDFLFGSVSAFETACAVFDLAPHGLPLHPPPDTQAAVQLASSLALASDYEAALRDPSRSCREVAASIGRSVTTVVAWRRERKIPIRERRKSLHPRVIGRVLEALGSLSSLQAVAKQTGVSVSSVYRILAQYPTTLRPHQDARGIAQLPARRERWMAAMLACQQNGMNRVTDARERAKADYAWLYRHDRVWLASTTSSGILIIQPRISGPARVDWGRRDAELCQVLDRRLTQLRNEVPPRRLTKTRLLRPLGETMVRHNVGKLPQLAALLDKAVETAEAFGKRRIDHAVYLLVMDGVQPQLWRIRRLAGLRRWSQALATYANQQIDRVNAQNSLHSNSLP